MHCFELTDWGVTKGLRVEAHPKPHVNITSDGSLYFDLEPRLGPLVQKAKAICPNDYIFIENLTIVTKNDDQYMAPCSPHHKEALVYLRVSAAPGGRVSLEASNNRGEFQKGDEIVSWFAPFPSLGISILGSPYGRETPWIDGAQQLELTLIMMKGSSFRIFRTAAPHGMQRVTYVKWSGSNLEVNRPMRHGMEIEARA